MSKKNAQGISPVLKALRARGAAVAAHCLSYAERKGGATPAVYDALFGIKAPPKEAYLASSIEQSVKAANVVGQELVKRLKKDPDDRTYLIFVTPPDLSARPSKIILDVRGFRKLKNDLKKCGIPNAIGVTKFLQRPASTRSKIETYLGHCMVIFGSQLTDEKLDTLQRFVATRFAAGGGSVMTYEEIDRTPAALMDAAAKVFDIADRTANSKATRKDAKLLGVEKWGKTRSLREFLRGQALSSVPFKALLVAHGDGERLADSALNEGKHAHKVLAKSSAQVIHRDQIAQFHASELIRLEMWNVQLPFLKTR